MFSVVQLLQSTSQTTLPMLKVWPFGPLILSMLAPASSSAMGFTDVQIMWLLPWNSAAFMTYLQNVAVLSDRHNLSFSEVRICLR